MDYLDKGESLRLGRCVEIVCFLQDLESVTSKKWKANDDTEG